MTFVLEAKTRTEKRKKTNSVRNAGGIPAVVYGKHQEPLSLTIAGHAFAKVYDEAGESTLVDLAIDGKEAMKVLIHEVQFDAVTQRPAHVDLYAVDMTQKLITEIPLVFTGESKAVKELGGTLVKNNDNLEITCLPKDLIHEIVVNIDALKTFDDRITAGDLKMPQGITLLDKPDEVIAYVAEPRSEKELEQLDEKIEEKIEEVEVEEKGKPKEEGEEGAETAAEEGKSSDKPEKK